MPIEVKLPNLGEGVESGDIVDVLVSEGDTITKDQAILDIETGKATTSLPSDFAGKVLKVHVQKGQTVKNGATLLTLELLLQVVRPLPLGCTCRKCQSCTCSGQNSRGSCTACYCPQTCIPCCCQTSTCCSCSRETGSRAATCRSSRTCRHARAGEKKRRKRRCCCRTCRSAVCCEVGVDLSRVAGSGPGGRISREDVVVVRAQGQGVGVNSSKTDAVRSVTATVRSTSKHDAKIRRMIAAQMHKSWTTCRVTNFDDADVTELEKIRVSSKDDYAKKGIKLTSWPFVVKAVAMAPSPIPG